MLATPGGAVAAVWGCVLETLQLARLFQSLPRSAEKVSAASFQLTPLVSLASTALLGGVEEVRVGTGTGGGVIITGEIIAEGVVGGG